jgi:dihydroorotase
MTRQTIINCKLASENSEGHTSVTFEDGVITAIADTAATTDVTIDAQGATLLPGFIDCYARLREPGFDSSANIASESVAAARSGFTTVMCSPDTDPVTDESAIVEQIKQRANEAHGPRILPIGAMTNGLKGEQLCELFTLSNAGCVAFSNADQPVENTQVLRKVMEFASGFDLPLIIAPQDPWLSIGVAHEGTVATRLGLAGIASAAETVALSQLIELGYQTGAQLHFSRLSTARGVSLVKQAKRDGIRVTADVGMHHLFLSEIDTSDFNSNFLNRPPFRTQDDLQALRAGVIEGVIDAISSNHAPLNRDSKLAPFSDCEPGTSSMDGFLSLLLRLVDETGAELATLADRVTTGPARCFSLPQGKIDIGAPADFCLLDRDHEWELTESEVISRGKNHPCIGWWLQGRVVQTIVDGRTIYQAGQDAS